MEQEISDKAKDVTPKKPAKRGPKIKEGVVNDICRLCSTNLKQKFGDFKKSSSISTVNIFKPSKQAGLETSETLADLCSRIGLDVLKSTTLSDRVCQSCARKVRNAAQLYDFIALGLNRNNEPSQISCSSQLSSCEESPRRFKRLLPTSISSPQRSPQPKKGHRRNTDVKKTLNFAEISNSENDENVEPLNVRLRDQGCHNLNVDGLTGNQTSQVKVVIVAPSGRVETHTSFDDKTKSMIVNLCRKNWQTVANSVFQQPHLREELVGPLCKAVDSEFKEYCSNSTDSVLKKSTPEELAAFSNKILVHEAEVWCPLWMACLKGACNVHRSSGEDSIKATNSLALSTAVAARCRNPTMSAVSYRISTVLFHSGVKHEDLKLLNKMCVCMSPDSIVDLERKMGENCEAKLCHWKKEIEQVKGAALLLNEVKKGQVGNHEDEEMRVDVDLSEETINSYEFYTSSAFSFCKEQFNNAGCNPNALTDLDLTAVSERISKIKLPYYRYICIGRALVTEQFLTILNFEVYNTIKLMYQLLWRKLLLLKIRYNYFFTIRMW